MPDPVETPNKQVPEGARDHVIGRTPWDFATEAIRSRTALLLVVAVFIVVPLAIHYFAEPNSEINLFLGLIKYKKASPPPEKAEAKPDPKPEPPRPEPIPATYMLPDKTVQRFAVAVPILDGTLNVTARGPLQESASLVLGGANVLRVRVAARTLDGNRLDIEANSEVRGWIVKGESEGIFQIEYLNHLFEIIVAPKDMVSYQLTVKTIDKATLELRAIGQK